jgi:hypothetical protein
MVEGHYLEISTTVHFSNWNSTSSGFHYATHLVWLVERHPLQFKGYKRNDIGLYIYSILRMFWFQRKFKKVICPVIIFRLESTIDGEIWH